LVEEQKPVYVKSKNDVVGIDLGIKNLAVTSQGEYFENPKALRKNLERLIFLQQRLSRKKKGSKNRYKQSLRLARLHYKISNIRRDVLHKLTSKIVNENQVIVLEDLKISNMMKNHNLAQAISDVGWSMFRQMIEYKSSWRGRNVEFVDTFFASSKTCSKCGWINHELKLSDRTFECKECSNKLDRDLNAAINILNYYLRKLEKLANNTVGLTEIHACGDGRSQNIMPQNCIQCLSEKQESNVMESIHV
jgi:putative transposase